MMKLFSFACFCTVFLLSLSSAESVPDSSFPQVHAVNLGGWLVTEGWMKPSLFDGIANKDFLDGTSLQLKSVTVGKYLSAENGGGSIIVANRTSPSGWETFTLWRINETSFNLRVFNKNFVGLDSDGNLTAGAVIHGAAETFEIQKNPNDKHSKLVRIKAPNGLFIQAKSEDTVSADYEGDSGWENNNPSVFELTIVRTLQGEYQITNGYGPSRAPEVMKEHWDTFIVENDFKFIKSNGLNAVRIPVGWWIAYGPSPPKPYVAGSLQALDRAFSWAQKYEIEVIIDLHAAADSQNGNDHSSTRDGSQEWGHTDDNINQTVHVIDFLTHRYAKNPRLFAVELINEPLSPGVSLKNLTKYYEQGYKAVRKHSQTAYVVLSNRLGPMEARELFNLTKQMTKVVIDVHYYNLFWDYYSNITVQQNIDYVYTNRTADLKELMTPNGPLIFVGEWVAELPLSNLTKNDIQRYGAAQLDVYGKYASFGWAYWSLKNVNNHWSLEWMINNGYIKLIS